jgi:cobalamin biosynthesis Mg chelatase CobN
MPSSDTSQCLRTGGNNTFYYWSYWHGASSGGWQYASDNFNTYVVTNGEVEGWRYQNPGADNSSATAPATTGSYVSLCGTIPSSTVPPPTSAPAPTTTATTGASGSTVTTAGKGGSASPRDATTTTSAPLVGHSSSTATTSTTGSVVSSSNHAAKHEAALATAADRARGPAGAPILPIVLVAAAIAVLGALSYLRWRRRPVEE